MLTKRNRERFSLSTELIVGNDIGRVFDGIGRDDLRVVRFRVRVAEVSFQNRFNVELLGNVGAILLNFLEDSDPCFPVTVALKFQSECSSL